MELIEKLKAGVKGGIIGDAIGVPYEFRSRNEMIFNPCKDMTGYGTYNKPSGTWSDDSSMVLATLDSIKDKKLDLNLLMLNFIDWETNGKYTQDGFMFDIGNTTHQALTLYKLSLNIEICGQRGENTNGNGSLMRIFPVAVYLYKLYGVDAFKHEEAVKLVRQVSSLTHAHEISVESCIIYVSVALHLLNDEGKKGIKKGIQEAREFVKNEALDVVFKSDFFDGSLKDFVGNGYVVNTLKASLFILYKTRNYEEAVLSAVNLGDDTDTTASVTGALAGVLYEGNIRKDWIDGVRKLDYAMSLCDEFIGKLK